MGKFIPLILASLKGFIRNWKSVLLLLIFPLIIIGTIFLSFNPEGMQKVPVGFIIPSAFTDTEEMSALKAAASNFMDVSEFSSLDDCLSEIKKYNAYACIDVNYQEYILLNVYFDNTREPIIWEVVQRIKSTVDFLQKEKTKEMASSVLTDFKSSINKVEDIRLSFIDVNSKIGTEISELESAIDKISNTQTELSNTLLEKDGYISVINDYDSRIDTLNKNSYSIHVGYIGSLESKINSISGLENQNLLFLNGAKSELQTLKSGLANQKDQSANLMNTINTQSSFYDSANNRMSSGINNLNSQVSNLKNVKQVLSSYKSDLDEIEKELPKVTEYQDLIDGVDPELLVNPVVVKNYQTYIPNTTSGQNDLMSKYIKINMSGLQTLYPGVLILITLFLSLLISSFICLSEINSSANQRLSTIKGIFIPEAISIYVSSMIVIFIPLFCIVSLGQFLFSLSILSNLPLVILIMFLLCSIFTFTGMAISYLIKKESTTLLICTFILVLLVFLSGFILPVERMSKIPNIIASNSPGTITLHAFNKLVFYGQGFLSIQAELIALSMWFSSLFAIVILIKKFRND